MTVLKATLELYQAALIDTGRSMGRSLWATAYLLAAQVAFVGLAVAMGGFGHAGGFVLGFAQAAMIGWYLALLEIAVVSRRPIRYRDLRDTVGQYFWETISVLFLFFLPELILRFTAPDLLLILVPIASLVFNPAPEVLYQERTQSTAALQDAMRFMQQNWPEWLGAHAVAGAVLVGWGWALTGRVDASWWPDVVQLFGPFFEFVMAGVLAIRLGGRGVAGIASLLGVFVFVHAFMLFRGHLYRRLRASSRRGRAWQARL